MARALFIAAFFFTMTPLLISLQWLLGKLNLLGWGFIASNYYRALCSLLRIRVRVNGEPVRRRAVLFVFNHVSWADILVIGSIAPVAFVAKREVADWPLVGITAKAQRTVFIDRARRHQTGDAVGKIVMRIENGISVVLFAEGTSSDGNRVAVPLCLARRSGGSGRPWQRRQHSDSADVNLLRRPTRHPDGAPAPPAGGLVRRSRLHAAYQSVYRAGCSRCLGHLWRAGYRRPRQGPQGHDQTTGRYGAPPFRGRSAQAGSWVSSR
jgi:1-acyl-sn-glycerol-3-phosphate acyltransferase